MLNGLVFVIEQRADKSWWIMFAPSDEYAYTDPAERPCTYAEAMLWMELKIQSEIVKAHDLCHNLHGKVDARAFADGCAQEQRNLYGCAPDADECERLTAALRAEKTWWEREKISGDIPRGVINKRLTALSAVLEDL